MTESTAQPEAGGGRPGFLPWIEAARACLMAGVVLVHVNILAAQEVALWWPFGRWACLGLGTMVPTFFFIAGFVVGLSDVTSPAFQPRRFWRRKLVTLIVPFLAWNCIMVVLDLAMATRFQIDEQGGARIGQIVFRVFTGYWQLYFIPALLQCFLILLLVRRCLRGRGLVFVVAAAVAVSALYYGLASLLFWTGVEQKGLLEDYVDRTFAPWVGFFFLGLFFGGAPARRAWLARTWWLFALLTLGAFQLFLYELDHALPRWPVPPILQFLAGGFVFQATGAIAFTGFFAWLGGLPSCERPVRWIARFATVAMGVYVCHTAVLIPLTLLWMRREISADPAVFVPALWAMTFCIAALLSYVARFLGRPGRLLFATRPGA